MKFKARIDRLATEFEELAHKDARRPLEERAILSLRSWELPEFGRLRRQ